MRPAAAGPFGRRFEEPASGPRLFDIGPLARRQIEFRRGLRRQIEREDAVLRRRVHREVERGAAIERADLDDLVAGRVAAAALASTASSARFTSPEFLRGSTMRIGLASMTSRQSATGRLVCCPRVDAAHAAAERAQVAAELGTGR